MPIKKPNDTSASGITSRETWLRRRDFLKAAAAAGLAAVSGLILFGGSAPAQAGEVVLTGDFAKAPFLGVYVDKDGNYDHVAPLTPNQKNDTDRGILQKGLRFYIDATAVAGQLINGNLTAPQLNAVLRLFVAGYSMLYGYNIIKNPPQSHRITVKNDLWGIECFRQYIKAARLKY